MVRALDPAVICVLWQAIYHLLPDHVDDHPLGCHRRRVPDLVCFRGLLIRLVTGSSWETVEALMEYKVSDTTLRARRDEWIAAGVFERLEAETRAGYDRIIGLELSYVALDGSIHKAPCGGEGTGKSPVDRAKIGYKWSVAVDANGIPIGVAIDGANRNDLTLLEPTLDAVAATGLLTGYRVAHLGSRLRLPGRAHSSRRLRTDRTRHPETRHQTTAGHTAAHHSRAAMDRRSTQLVDVQLRPTPTINRPHQHPPTRRAQPRHHRADDLPPHRLPRQMGHRPDAYPLSP